MNLNPQRPWVTPLVIGIFALMAITGTLMFFHLDSGLNKVAHEWLGWAMVVAVALHVLLNLNAFNRYFKQKTGRWVMAACAVLLALTFVPLGSAEDGKPSFVRPMQAMANVPLNTVAQVAGIPTAEVRSRLERNGIPSQADTQTVKDLVGTDLKAQMRALNKVFGS